MRPTLKHIAHNLHTLHTELHTTPLSTRPHSQTGVRSGTTGSTPPCNITSLDYLIDVDTRLTELCMNIATDLAIPITPGTHSAAQWCAWLYRHWDNLDPLTWKEDLEQELTDLDAELQAKLHPTTTDLTHEHRQTARSICHRLATMGHNTQPATLRQWARRGHITSVPVEGNRNGYLLTEVLNYMTYTSEENQEKEVP